MESNIKIFVRTTIFITTVFIVLLVLFSVAYAYATLIVYNAILITIIIAICLCILALALIFSAVFYIYRNKNAKGLLLMLTKWGLKFLLPIAVILTKSNSGTKKSIRNFYIEINNIVVESDYKRYRLQDTLLLLPHCLQNNECGLKVTSDPYLCKRCGKCKIGALIEYAEQKNIKIFIATGGTVARNIIKKIKPKLIVSVACERDLMSGISDVTGIPVVGITNRQPNGSCFNTDVDIENIKKKINELTLEV